MSHAEYWSLVHQHKAGTLLEKIGILNDKEIELDNKIANMDIGAYGSEQITPECEACIQELEGVRRALDKAKWIFNAIVRILQRYS